MPTTERVFQIFKELNQIPRPSHHEERVADYLCQFAERLHLDYKRDKENCVAISACSSVICVRAIFITSLYVRRASSMLS